MGLIAREHILMKKYVYIITVTAKFTIIFFVLFYIVNINYGLKLFRQICSHINDIKINQT